MIQPLGTKCPKCGVTKPNPDARHVKLPDGTWEFRNIVQAIELRTCEECLRDKHEKSG